MSAVYTTQELCEVMACGPNRARKVMTDAGVMPIDLGAGRGGGLRWMKDSVIEALHTLERKNEPPTKVVRCRRHSVVGKDADDLIREFNRERMPIQ